MCHPRLPQKSFPVWGILLLGTAASLGLVDLVPTAWATLDPRSRGVLVALLIGGFGLIAAMFACAWWAKAQEQAAAAATARLRAARCRSPRSLPEAA